MNPVFCPQDGDRILAQAWTNMDTLENEGIGLVCRQLAGAVTYQTQWSKSQHFTRAIAQPAWIEGRKKNNMARSGF